MALYLVTGGAGFIGSNLVEELLKKGNEVRVIDNFATGHRENIEPFLKEIEFLEHDLAKMNGLIDIFMGVDYVLHQAALPSVPRSIEDPVGCFRATVEGTLNVLEASRKAGVKKVVFASSSSVYGNSPQLPKKETMKPAPLSPYAAAKLAAETYCQVYHRVYGLDTVSLRYFNVFGPRQDPQSQYAAVIPKFILASLEGRAVAIFGDGQASRDFTYVDNVVSANLLAAEGNVGSGEVFNLACGDRITINRLVQVIGKLAERRLDKVHSSPRPGDVPHSQADLSKISRTFGYRTLVSFEEGMQRTFNYFEKVFLKKGDSRSK